MAFKPEPARLAKKGDFVLNKTIPLLAILISISATTFASDDRLPADRHRDKSPKCLNDCGLGGTVVTIGCAAATFFTFGAASPLCTAGIAAMAACMDRCPPKDGAEAPYTGQTYGPGFLGQYRSALHETDRSFAFAVAKNGDIFAIKKSGTGTKSTEVHVLSAKDNYQSFALQTGTALHETDDAFDFALAPNRDLFAIKKMKTGTNSTEVHILTADSNYKKFGLHTTTALNETGNNFEFAVADNRDLFAIKKSETGTNSTEVHVLSAASNYKKFGLQTGTALHPTDNSFNFALAANRDLYAVKKRGTGTKSTEVHVLSAASGYKNFATQTGTALHETGDEFQFEITSNRKLVAIKQSGTGSKTTEVHILDAP